MKGLLLVLLIVLAVPASAAPRENPSWKDDLREGVAALFDGDYDHAEVLLHRAREQASALEADELDIARTTCALGYLHHLKGEFSQAEPLFTQSIKVFERSGPAAVADLAVSLEGLGEVRLEQSRFEEAEHLFSRAIELNTSVRGAGDARTLTSLRHLGETYRRQGRFAEAETAFRRAVEGLRSTRRTPALASAMTGLGMLYCDEGRLDEAESLLSEALSLNLTGGDAQPEVADSMLALATAFRESGKLDRAMPLLKKAQRIYLEHNDARVALALHGIGAIHYLEGRKAMAEEAFVEAIRLAGGLRGPHARSVALISIDLAVVYAADNRQKEARSLLETSLPVIRATGESRQTARALIILASIHALQREKDLALAEYREGIAMLSRFVPAENPALIAARKEYTTLSKRYRR